MWYEESNLRVHNKQLHNHASIIRFLHYTHLGIDLGVVKSTTHWLKQPQMRRAVTCPIKIWTIILLVSQNVKKEEAYLLPYSSFMCVIKNQILIGDVITQHISMVTLTNYVVDRTIPIEIM